MHSHQPPNLFIRDVPWSNPVGADLRRAQQAELQSRSGGDSREPEPPTAEDTAVFVIAYARSSGQPLGCGGLRTVDSATAEVKRIYVLPYARGSGIATAILTALELRARAAGYGLVTAEAGSAQPDGRRFYEQAGYEVVTNFGPYTDLPNSTCYAKAIEPGMRSAPPEISPAQLEMP